ncbi:MAG: DNA polymerase domain-containing protein [Acidobacteriota bacterium]
MRRPDLRFAQNELLFGWNQTPGLVAVELEGDNRMRVYRRTAEGIASELQDFSPFLLLAEDHPLRGFKTEYKLIPLSGFSHYRYLAVFSGWKACQQAHRALARAPESHIFLNDPEHQHLLLTGQTSFHSLLFQDLRRMQLDIETYSAPGFEFSNPERAEDRVIAIALSDSSGWEQVLRGNEMDEPEMLRTLNSLVQERDPDVIEGHNLFKFDLKYLATRGRRHGVRLTWGRDASEISWRASRLFIAERTIDYPRWKVFGRHVVDTWILAQFYDLANRELENLSLKEIARHFGLASEGRTYIDGGSISRIYNEEPDLLFRYALDDVRETEGLSRLLSPSYFIQAQIFPYGYQGVILRGNATRINSLFLREYLRRRHSVPAGPASGQEFAGGYTDIFEEGVVRNVLHCDVTSLYPSIMLSRSIKPAGDDLNVFLPLLRDLRDFRVEAKRLAQQSQEQEMRAHYQSLQSTFKILINSFYGYLGTTFSNFSDYAAAAQVTEIGREILKSMIDWLRAAGCRVIEIDTDGIYFVPPADCGNPQAQQGLVERLTMTLPEGINAELDGRYSAMLSYKMKNYALLAEDGSVVIRGSGLRSRGLEPYLRGFLREVIHLLLRGQEDRIQALKEDYFSRLEKHQFDIAHLCRTETLSESVASYRQKVLDKARSPSALYELAIRANRELQAGDQLSYYVTGHTKKLTVYENCKLLTLWDPQHPDENVPYYKSRIEDLLEKFSKFLPPSRELKQGQLDLG